MEPLKNLFNKQCIESMSFYLKEYYSPFQSAPFVDALLTAEWENRELKDRMGCIATAFYEHLDLSYSDSLEVLKKVSLHFEGLVHMVFPTYVEFFGLEHYEDSVQAMQFFTERSSSEFAVRHFIIKYPEAMIKQLKLWAQSENHHIRRLASEGCRPRLPWAIALPQFKKNPEPILPVLEMLKEDESEYVRRSVANNLNDISKDNPERVISIAKSWMGLNPLTDKLVKHGCRTLLKKGRPEVLELFGLKKPDHITLENVEIEPEVKMGSQINLKFRIKTDSEKLGLLRIEYAMDYRMKNGSYSRKVFKISESRWSEKVKDITRKISFRPITTRTFYKGQQGVSIIINGVEMAYLNFELV